MGDNRDQIEQIRDRLDIVNVIQRYVRLKKAGRNYVGLCPFHNEKTPSFSVNPELQIFKCFGCGKGGDLFAFVQDIEKIDFPETLERLAAEAGVKLVKTGFAGKFKELEEINDIARRFYSHHLLQSKNVQALKYLKNRGLKDSDIKTFSIGFAPGGDLLLEYFRKLKRYSDTQLITSGLFVEKEGKIREKFILRIMFPILSTRGKTIGFSGRIMPENKYGPKYMNSPETPLFSKKMGVYGIYESRQGIRREDLCVVTEGQVDVISAHSIGIENIVAPLGTAFTQEQAQVISRMTKNILFVFDNDKAGQAALERAFLITTKLGLNAYAASPAPYKDLDELIQKDPKGAKSIIKGNTDAFSYLISQKVKNANLNDYATYTKVLNYTNKLISAVTEPSIKDFYIRKVKQIADIDLHQAPRQQKKREEDQTIKNSRLSTEEYYLQALLGQSKLGVPENHNLEAFTDDSVKGILRAIQDHKPENLKELNGHLEPELSELLVRISIDPVATENENLDVIYKRILKTNIQSRLLALKTKLALAEETKDRKEIAILLEKIQKETIKLKAIN